MPPLHLLVDVLLYAVAPAAAVAAAVLFVTCACAGTKAAPVGAALALAAGVGCGFWLRGTLTLVPGDSAWNYIPWAGLAALALGLATRWPRIPRVVAWLLRLGSAAGIAWWVIPPSLRSETPWLPVLLAGVVFAEWAILEYLAGRPIGGTVPLAFAASAFVASVVLIHAGSARLTDAATVLSATCAGIGLIAWWKRLDAGGAVPGAAMLHPALLLLGQQETFSEISWAAFLLAANAPLMLAIALPFRGQTSRWHVLWLIALLPPLVAALALALQAGPLEFE